MILTCPQCQAQYKLDPAALGASGRDVRCVGCSHVWFQMPDTAISGPPKPEEIAALPPEQPSVKSITDALNSILEKDDAAFEAVLSTVTKNAKGDAPVAIAEEKRQMVRQEGVLPIVTHNPLGMGASVFGGMVFLLCTFLTLAVVFAAKGPIVEHWPQMSLLYKTIGFDVKAPGEGLRLSEITAEKRIDDRSKTLVVEGKMTNMTEHGIAYPALQVVLKNDQSLITKEWDLKPGVTQIASGDVVPVMLQLERAPEDGSTVEVRVKGR